MRLKCLLCEGSGIGAGMRAGFGELMNLCDRCEGHGFITDEPGRRDFVAIFPVSARYGVHMTIPRRKGGFVEMDIQWFPNLPRDKGRSKLTASEKAAYERGRNQALAVLMDQMGGGDFSVVTAKERH
jgi:hypothetical protein